MEKAARWVISDILPLVREKRPDTWLYVVGKNSDVILADMEENGVTITGSLPSVLPYLCNSAVALVPLQYESGTRFKILEAGACRIPVVSTTLGAEGLDVINRENILIANTATDFARAIVSVLEDRSLADKLGKNLRDLIARDYSIPRLEAEAREIINQLMRS